MASKRELKKDVSFLFEQLLQTCFLYGELNKSNTEYQARISELIVQAAEAYEVTLNSISTPSVDLNGKSLKTYYRDVLAGMLKSASEIYEELEKLEPAD